MITESNITPRNSLIPSSLVFGLLSFAPLASMALAFVTGHTQLSNFNLVVLFMGIEVAFGITAIVTGVVSLKRDRKQEKASVTGVALGGLTVISVLLIVWVF